MFVESVKGFSKSFARFAGKLISKRDEYSSQVLEEAIAQIRRYIILFCGYNARHFAYFSLSFLSEILEEQVLP